MAEKVRIGCKSELLKKVSVCVRGVGGGGGYGTGGPPGLSGLGYLIV